MSLSIFEIINFVLSYYLISGMVLAIMVLILIQITFKNFKTKLAIKIIKIIFLFSGSWMIFSLFFHNVFSESPSVMGFNLNRATGPYWWAYLTMILSNTILPFVLLIKNLGENIYIVFVISIFMNVGSIMEFIVLHSVYWHSGSSFKLLQAEIDMLISATSLSILFVIVSFFQTRKQLVRV